MKSLFNKKKRVPNNKYIALDIGTEVLKALLFSVEETHVDILSVSRINQQEPAMNKGNIRNLDLVLSNCRLALNQLFDNVDDRNRPDQIVLGLAGEYIQGISITVNYE